MRKNAPYPEFAPIIKTLHQSGLSLKQTADHLEQYYGFTKTTAYRLAQVYYPGFGREKPVSRRFVRGNSDATTTINTSESGKYHTLKFAGHDVGGTSKAALARYAKKLGAKKIVFVKEKPKFSFGHGLENPGYSATIYVDYYGKQYHATYDSDGDIVRKSSDDRLEIVRWAKQCMGGTICKIVWMEGCPKPGFQTV